MYTVGTAGHVDHGKSTLIHALTGIDPDRLREEKERGMTIDLGFAWLTLPSGREISIVDVPGHERFVKNMLAGVGGIDAALLVIAADEGIMPQTREHLAILDLLGIERGLVALTKTDLVDEEWIALVQEEIGETLRGTSLAAAPLVPVAALRGDGLDSLKHRLDALLESTPAKRDLGRPRLPIDRVFSLGGFGTVVTGTLLDGALHVGQELEVLPRGLATRARGLQSHKSKIEVALPGRRVAVNLGGLATEDIQRGDVVTVPHGLRPTAALDVRLRLLAGVPKALANAAAVSFHTGTAEAVGKVTLLDRDSLTPGEETWAQVRLRTPVAVAKNDLFIIRQLSPAVTLGGGQVVDPAPSRRHRRRQPGVIAALETLARGTPEEVVLQTVELKEPAEPAAIVRASGLDATTAQAALEALLGSGQVIRLGQTVLSQSGWRRWKDSVAEHLDHYHHQYPLRPGMPREELKSRLRLPTRLFNDAVAGLVAEGALVETGTAVRLPNHQVHLSPAQQSLTDRLLTRLRATPLAPPSLAELRLELVASVSGGGANSGATPGATLDDELLGALVALGSIVRIGDDLVFAADTYREMVAAITGHLQQQGTITVAEVRDRFGTSRRYVLALLEHLDREHVTRRVGDERVLAVKPTPPPTPVEPHSGVS
ncbi:MAG: selenocysteine-specific translation elongation factor [Chloroflexota bacterium]|nr:selenocysteine-specific translation elongation factor [Chloroflexota bacterium]